jgi:hypothetical protein
MAKKLKILPVLFILIALLPFLAWYHRYSISDFLVLRGYKPPEAIEQLALLDDFSSYGQRLFYVNKPEILGRDEFYKQCTVNEQTIVLGCYKGNSIYLFKVEDVRLDGVEQVTAAHEMLHEAYTRLSAKERKRIDKLVDDVYKKSNDERLTKLAADYQKQEPGSVPNEMHSILATEVKDVGSELETYYKKYFNNRSVIVSYSQKYEKVFEDLRSQVAQYDADLLAKKNLIDSKELILEQLSQEIAQQKSLMDAYLAQNNISAFNGQVKSYNQKVADYNSGVSEIKDLIESYNAIVAARNLISVEQQNLAKSIDSHPASLN